MRILFLTHRLPYAANRGDRIRALHILRHLSASTTVDLVSLVHDADEAGHAQDLRGVAATVAVARTRPWTGYGRVLAALPTWLPLTHALLDAPDLSRLVHETVRRHRPDVVLAYGSGMARLALEPPLTSIPFVLDMVDVDSEKWAVLGRTASPPARWIYATEGRRLAAFERRAAQEAEAVLVVNERERKAMLRIQPAANVHVVQQGIALDEFRPTGPPAVAPLVTFCGVMNYEPNEEAALWLGRDVWPRIRSAMPAARLSLVGSRPTAAVRALASDTSIEVTGTVPDVRPYLWRSAVATAPLNLARGVQNKVLEAVAAGLPCVVTPAVSEGLPDEVMASCRVADGAAGLAEAILKLLALTPDERRGIAARADLRGLAWPQRLAPLLPILDEARSQPTKRSTPAAKGVAGS